MNAAEKLLMNHADMAHLELASWLGDAATLQAAHPVISVKKDPWVPGATEFLQHKEAILKHLETAKALNLTTTKELEEAVAAALDDININANYLFLRAKHEKNEAWLHNNGYQLKEKAKRNYDKLVSATALLLRLKNGPGIGEVTANWDRDQAAGSYQLQICKGRPQGEEPFVDQGYFKKVRTTISDLERASWYYFRVRSVGNNEIGPWSEPVGIIVT